MRKTFLLLALLVAKMAFAQKKEFFFSTGIDYRQYPIDIEDVPRGPSLGDNGLPHDDGKFWQTFSLLTRYGLVTKKNWQFSFSLYGRYNFLNRTQNLNFSYDYTNYPKNIQHKKNVKFDIFLDVEKKIRVTKKLESFFVIDAGLGLTNINSGFDVTLTDSLEHRPFPPERYKGTFLHFGPRLSVGYQYKKIKASMDAYLIEGPDLTNLNSLWLGATLSYEFILKKKKKYF